MKGVFIAVAATMVTCTYQFEQLKMKYFRLSNGCPAIGGSLHYTCAMDHKEFAANRMWNQYLLRMNCFKQNVENKAFKTSSDGQQLSVLQQACSNRTEQAHLMLESSSLDRSWCTRFEAVIISNMTMEHDLELT